MLKTYNVLKTIHVLAAVIWVGGNLTTNIWGTRIVNSNDGPRMAGFARDAAWTGERIYLPASIIVLVFGVLGVINGYPNFSDAWVGIGLTGIIITALTGSMFFGPELKRIAALAESRGPADPELKQRTTRLVTMARVDLVILVLVVVVMVLKPEA
jgi:uncharacterized membrane protein